MMSTLGLVSKSLSKANELKAFVNIKFSVLPVFFVCAYAFISVAVHSSCALLMDIAAKYIF